MLNTTCEVSKSVVRSGDFQIIAFATEYQLLKTMSFIKTDAEIAFPTHITSYR